MRERQAHHRKGENPGREANSRLIVKNDTDAVWTRRCQFLDPWMIASRKHWITGHTASRKSHFIRMTKLLEASLNGPSACKYSWSREYFTRLTQYWDLVFCLHLNWHVRRMVYMREPAICCCIFYEVPCRWCWQRPHCTRFYVTKAPIRRYGHFPLRSC